MFALKNFFSGTSALVDPGTSGALVTFDITIGTVTNVNRTMFFYTEAVDADVSFTRYATAVRLLDASTLRVNWRNVYGQITTHTIRWWIMEFVEGVTVQHYYSATQPSSPITINPVNTENSFIIPSWNINNSEGSSSQVNAGANFSFASGSSVTMANSGALMAEVSMQVVQWDGAYAQHSITNINATTPVDVTISNVNTERAVVFSSNNWTSASDPTEVDQFARCFLNSSTALRLSTDATGYSQDIASSVVTIPQFSIQRGLSTFPGTADSSSYNVTIPAVNVVNSVAWVSMPNRPWARRNEPLTPNVYPGAHATKVIFNSATELNLARGRGWSAADVDWQILEFQPPPPRSGFISFQNPGIA